MRILIATTIVRYGAGVVISDLCRRLVEKGHQVHLASTTHSEQQEWPHLMDQLRSAGTRLIQVELFKRDPTNLWRASHALCSLLREGSFDLLHAHSGTPAFALHAARIKSGQRWQPLIGTLHGFSGQPRPRWMDQMDRYAWSCCNAVTAVSESCAAAARDRGIRADQIIRPGIRDPKSLRPADPKVTDLMNELRSQGFKIVLQVAEVTPRKGQAVLVRAARELVAVSELRIACVFVGGCSDEAYRRSTIEAAGRSPRLKLLFAGETAYPQEFIRHADVSALPTYSEGLGLSILESVAQRVPVCFSYVPGTQDLAEQLGLGSFTHEAGNHAQLAALLAAMLRNPPAAAALNSLADEARSRFACDSFADAHERLYHRLVRAASRSPSLRDSRDSPKAASPRLPYPPRFAAGQANADAE